VELIELLIGSWNCSGTCGIAGDDERAAKPPEPELAKPHSQGEVPWVSA
jgi:hypothetical protein